MRYYILTLKHKYVMLFLRHIKILRIHKKILPPPPFKTTIFRWLQQINLLEYKIQNFEFILNALNHRFKASKIISGVWYQNYP